MSLALAVAFWMAGAGCMLGCENMVSAATSTEIASPANSSAMVVTGEACASMQSHNCCAKRKAHSAAKAVTPPTSDQRQFADSGTKIQFDAVFPALWGTFPMMMDCPLAVNATAVLSKARPDQSNVALPTRIGMASLSNPPEQTSAFARPLRLPNRGHTYLHCCSFLI